MRWPVSTVKAVATPYKGRVVYMIEVRDWTDFTKWSPCGFGGFSKSAARHEIRHDWQRRFPEQVFRARKYVQAREVLA